MSDFNILGNIKIDGVDLSQLENRLKLVFGKAGAQLSKSLDKGSTLFTDGLSNAFKVAKAIQKLESDSIEAKLAVTALSNSFRNFGGDADRLLSAVNIFAKLKDVVQKLNTTFDQNEVKEYQNAIQSLRKDLVSLGANASEKKSLGQFFDGAKVKEVDKAYQNLGKTIDETVAKQQKFNKRASEFGTDVSTLTSRRSDSKGRFISSSQELELAAKKGQEERIQTLTAESASTISRQRQQKRKLAKEAEKEDANLREAAARNAQESADRVRKAEQQARREDNKRIQQEEEEKQKILDNFRKARVEQEKREGQNAAKAYAVSYDQAKKVAEQKEAELEQIAKARLLWRKGLQIQEQRLDKEAEKAVQESTTRLIALERKKQQLLSAVSKAGNQAQLGDVVDRVNREIALEKSIIATRGGVLRSSGGSGPVVPDPKSSEARLQRNQLLQAIEDQRRLNNAIAQGESNAFNFGRSVGFAFKRFGAFVVGSSPIFLLLAALRNANTEALKFEQQITKITQVISNVPRTEVLATIGTSINNSAVATGTQVNEIAQGVQTFAQAGYTDPRQLEKVARLLSQVPLSATFGTIEETANGLIAIFGQFNKDLEDTGRILDLVNRYAADFAVESQDIFEAATRGGAAFATAGGSLEEFIQLFTVLRSASRETASTLGQFFKSGIAELLNPRSQGILRELGVQSDDVLEQLKELSEILPTLSSSQQINVTQELVGTRQFNRLLTLLGEIGNPEIQAKLKKTSESVTGSFTRDAALRLDDIGTSLNRITQSFNKFVNQLYENQGIRSFAKDIANIAENLSGLGSIIQAVLPLLLALAGSRIIKSLPEFFGGFGSVLGIGKGAKQSLSDSASLVKDLFTGNPADRKAAGSLLFGKGGSARSLLAGGAGLAGIGISLGGSIIASNTQNQNVKDAANIATSTANFALLGAAIGSVIPVIGTGLGAVVGGAIGLFTELNSVINQRIESERALIFSRAKDNTTRRSLLVNEAAKGFELSRTFSKRTIPGEGLISPIKDRDPIFSKRIADTLFDSSFRGRIDFNTTIQSEIEKKLKEFANSFKDQSLDESIDGKIITGDILNSVAEVITKDINRILSFSNLPPIDVSVIRDKIQKDVDSGALTVDTSGVFEAQKKADEAFQRKQREEESRGIKFFENIFDTNRLYSNLNNALDKVIKNLTQVSDKFAALTTDLNSLGRILVPQNEDDILRAGGFDSLNNLNNQNQLIADQINELFDASIASGFRGTSSFRTVIRDLRNAGSLDIEEGQEIPSIFNSLLAGIDSKQVREGFVKQFKDLFERIAAEAGTTVDDVLKAVINANGRDLASVIGDLRQGGLSEARQRAIEATKQLIEIENKRIEIQDTLRDQILNLNAALFEAQNNIRSFEDAIQDRQLAQSNFVNETGAIQSSQDLANILLSRAGRSQFGNQGQFISDLLSSANNRNLAKRNLDVSNSRGEISRTNLQADADARLEFNKRQIELNQRLNDLSARVDNAASAADTLRQAFTGLRDQIRSAGQAVTSFTVKDLAKSFNAIRDFRSGGINNLTDKGFESLQKILSAVGDFDLGNGISGSKLLGNINQELGTELLATVRSLFTGESVESASQAINTQLESLKKQQEDAAKLEQSLREQQLQLLQAQSQVIPIEIQFYQDQLQKLDELSANIGDPLKQIRDKVAILYDQALPVVIGKGNEQSSNPSNNLINNSSNRSFFNLPSNFRENIVRPNDLPGVPNIPTRIIPNVISPDSIPSNADPRRFFTPQGQPRFIGGNDGPSRIVPNKQEIDPSIFPTFERPNKQFIGANPEFTPVVEKISSLSDNINKLSLAIAQYNTNLNIKPNSEIGQVGNFTLDVAPIQVNVALTAPDILSLAGNQLYKAVISKLIPVLSETFGVSSNEAKNFFDSNIPKDL